jgi:hypothetical protein
MNEENLSKKQFSGFLGNRVLDFNASKMVKARTGVTKAIPVDNGVPLSESSEKHIQDMLKLNAPKKKSLAEKYTSKIGKFLGLEE